MRKKNLPVFIYQLVSSASLSFFFLLPSMTQPLSFSELCKNSRADTRTHVHTDIRRTRQREEGKKKKYTTAEFSDKSDQQFSLFFFSLKLQLQAFYFFELNTPRFMVKWSGDSLITRMARNCKIKVLGWVSPLFFLKLLNNTHRNKSQVSSFFFVPLPVFFSPQENNTHTHAHRNSEKKKTINEGATICNSVYFYFEGC